jgi:orotate phosphoribosyltransferase
VCGVLAICDRLAGGAEAIEQAAGAPFVALTTSTTSIPSAPTVPTV